MKNMHIALIHAQKEYSKIKEYISLCDIGMYDYTIYNNIESKNNTYDFSFKAYQYIKDNYILFDITGKILFPNIIEKMSKAIVRKQGRTLAKSINAILNYIIINGKYKAMHHMVKYDAVISSLYHIDTLVPNIAFIVPYDITLDKALDLFIDKNILAAMLKNDSKLLNSIEDSRQINKVLNDVINGILNPFLQDDEISWATLDNRFINQNIYIPGYRGVDGTKHLLFFIIDNNAKDNFVIKNNNINNNTLLSNNITATTIIYNVKTSSIFIKDTQDYIVKLNLKYDEIIKIIEKNAINNELYDGLIMILNNTKDKHNESISELYSDILSDFQFNTIQTWRNNGRWNKTENII